LVTDLDPRVERPSLGDQSRRRPRVQAVRGGDGEPAGHLGGRRAPGRRLVDRPEVGLFAGERRGGLRGHLRAPGAASRRDGRNDEPFDERGGAEQDLLPGSVVEQVQGEFGGEYGTAEVHQDDDAVPGVRRGDRGDDLRRVRTEGGVVEARGDFDPCRRGVRHLAGETDRRSGEGPAVRHDDKADHDDPPTPEWPSSVAAAWSSRVTDVAPGSWWPTLRSPR
jgi:hypothetical protein